MFQLIKNYLSSFSYKHIAYDWVVYNEAMQGLAGAGTVQALGKAAQWIDPNKSYLEVGIYQAANFVGVAKTASKTKCYGVDNFSQEFEENKRFEMSTEEVVRQRIKDHNLKNATVFKKDFRQFLKTANIEPVELYFFDGPHEYQDQFDGVEMAMPLLSDKAVIVVDDWASENVQNSTKDLLEKYPNNLKVINLFFAPLNDRQYFNQGQVVMEYQK